MSDSNHPPRRGCFCKRCYDWAHLLVKRDIETGIWMTQQQIDESTEKSAKQLQDIVSLESRIQLLEAKVIDLEQLLASVWHTAALAIGISCPGTLNDLRESIARAKSEKAIIDSLNIEKNDGT